MLFLAKDGQGFSPEGLSDHIGRMIRDSGLRERGSCHLLRHTMATQMLDTGDAGPCRHQHHTDLHTGQHLGGAGDTPGNASD